MGLLRPIQVQPWTPPQLPQQQPQAPLMPMPDTSQAWSGPTFMQSFQDTLNSPMLMQGMAMLGAAQPGGGGWGQAAQSIMDINQNYQQQLRQRRQDSRDNAAWGRQQTQWGQEDQTRAAWETAVSREVDPSRQATLRALGPQGYGDWMAGEQQRAFAAQQQQNQQEFQSREGQLDRDAAARNARIATTIRRDPRDSIQYRNDIARLSEMGSAANFASRVVLPRIQRGREIIARLAEIGGMDNPLSADRRIQLSQIGQFGTEARGLLQELSRIQTQFTVEDARALAPVSNTDFGRLQDINPNGNMTIDAAYRVFDTMEREISAGVNGYTAAAQWADTYGGLTGTLDAQGRTFEQVQLANATAPPRAPASPDQSAQAPLLTQSLPPPRGLQEGTRARDSQSGREFIVRNGAWQPVTNSSVGAAARRLNNGNLR